MKVGPCENAPLFQEETSAYITLTSFSLSGTRPLNIPDLSWDSTDLSSLDVWHSPLKGFKCVKPTSEMYLYKILLIIIPLHIVYFAFICNILILWGNLFYCVNIIIIEKKCKYSIPANEPFYIYIKIF